MGSFRFQTPDIQIFGSLNISEFCMDRLNDSKTNIAKTNLQVYPNKVLQELVYWYYIAFQQSFIFCLMKLLYSKQISNIGLKR